jgi:ABC-2 type transport system permease protein
MLESAVAEANDRMAGRTAAVKIREVPFQAILGSLRYAFTAYSPGMIVFALLTLIPATAVLLGREMRKRTLERLRMSELSTMEYLCGVGPAQLALGFVQASLVVIALQAAHIPMIRLWPVVLLTIVIIAASSIAVGLMLGSFIRNDSQAVNIGYAVTMVQVFMCGAFFPVPTPALLTIAGHQIGFFDWLPATHGVLALQQALIFGSGVEQVGFRLGVAALLAALWFGIAVLLFRRARMGDTVEG